ncbi:MAG: ABC transporter permease, partial [Rhodobacteraceae bacterium]|nr:ABC transporter permease [Paracoccaceae bacterium]
MFHFCADPDSLEGAAWAVCYLTTGKHMLFYGSFLTVLGLLAVTAPLALAFGFAGALAARSRALPLRWLGSGYMAMVRGIPDIVFFLFVPIALDQGLEWLMHQVRCPDWTEPIRRGS